MHLLRRGHCKVGGAAKKPGGGQSHPRGKIKINKRNPNRAPKKPQKSPKSNHVRAGSSSQRRNLGRGGGSRLRLGGGSALPPPVQRAEHPISGPPPLPTPHPKPAATPPPASGRPGERPAGGGGSPSSSSSSSGAGDKSTCNPLPGEKKKKKKTVLIKDDAAGLAGRQPPHAQE